MLLINIVASWLFLDMKNNPYEILIKPTYFEMFDFQGILVMIILFPQYSFHSSSFFLFLLPYLAIIWTNSSYSSDSLSHPQVLFKFLIADINTEYLIYHNIAALNKRFLIMKLEMNNYYIKWRIYCSLNCVVRNRVNLTRIQKLHSLSFPRKL